MYDVAIVGGGASGLMAAYAAAKYNASVILFEKNPRVGKKLITTGNGRCNLTNNGDLVGRYHGDKQFAYHVFDNVSRETILKTFEEMGLFTCELEDGKVFPMSLQAGSVVDALRFSLDRLGVTVKYNADVQKCRKTRNSFIIEYENESIESEKLIICAGGSVMPSSGSDGSGIKLLSSFGHKSTEIFPSLVQLKTETNKIKAITGLKVNGKLSGILNNGEEISRFGEILFTTYGISGPAVLQISRFAPNFHNNRLFIDMLPNISEEQLFTMIKSKIVCTAELPISQILLGIVHSRIGESIVRRICKDASNRLCDSVSDEEIINVSRETKGMCLEIKGNTGFKEAQVTAGGIKTQEFNPNTMESMLCKGLYAAGEVLNVDGDCGGFNLQWAWSSGMLSGINAANSIKRG